MLSLVDSVTDAIQLPALLLDLMNPVKFEFQAACINAIATMLLYYIICTLFLAAKAIWIKREHSLMHAQ